MAVVGHGFTKVIAAAQPLHTKGQGHSHVEFRVGDEFAITVELPSSCRSFPIRNVGLARRLELVTKSSKESWQQFKQLMRTLEYAQLLTYGKDLSSSRHVQLVGRTTPTTVALCFVWKRLGQRLTAINART